MRRSSFMVLGLSILAATALGGCTASTIDDGSRGSSDEPSVSPSGAELEREEQPSGPKSEAATRPDDWSRAGVSSNPPTEPALLPSEPACQSDADCGAPACFDGVSERFFCDSAGQCQPQLIACGAYACGPSDCFTECATNDQCATGHVCHAGACVPLISPPPQTKAPYWGQPSL